MVNLSACGFQLRGYHSSLLANDASVKLIFGETAQEIMIKNALKQHLSQVAIDSHDEATSHIQVSHIQLKSYPLRGLLTEIQLVLQANVSYTINKNGQVNTIQQRLQVQRSYQYNQASVSTEDPQAEQIHHWLYDNLAQRIADQYVALNLH